MKRIINYFRRIYRLHTDFSKHEVLVWKSLKKIHFENEWYSGVYENEKKIETVFCMADDKPKRFLYVINDYCFYCTVKVLDNYPIELTTDLFILAAHFNNLLNNGTVKVNTEDLFVEYLVKRDALIPLLYPEEIHHQIVQHHYTSNDIYWAFQKLVEENEAPAIIIADLLRKKEDEKQDKKN